ncbi:hypothetical protein [Streptomyces poriferorum]
MGLVIADETAVVHDSTAWLHQFKRLRIRYEPTFIRAFSNWPAA